MLNLSNILFVLFLHWVGDFVLQSDKTAKRKGTSNLTLSYHVGTYSLSLFVGSLLIMSPIQGLIYVLINGSFHFVTDYWTSRWTKKVYDTSDPHNFFVVIGLDQFLHSIVLLGALAIL